MLQECSTEQLKMNIYRKWGRGLGGGGVLGVFQYATSTYVCIYFSQVQNIICMIFFINTKQYNKHEYKSNVLAL